MSLREAAKAALEALHIGASAAESIAEQYHEAMKGYRQARHDALDADVRTIRTAIEGISAALAEADPMQCEHCGIQFPDKQPGSLCPKCHREVTRAEAEKAEPVAIHPLEFTDEDIEEIWWNTVRDVPRDSTNREIRVACVRAVLAAARGKG